jgi:hypothetical protein
MYIVRTFRSNLVPASKLRIQEGVTRFFLEGGEVLQLYWDCWLSCTAVWKGNIAFFMFEFPCIITIYYIKNQQDATLAVLFISHCKITLHVSDAFCVHHQEY